MNDKQLIVGVMDKNKHEALLQIGCTKAQAGAMLRQANREGMDFNNWARNVLLRELNKAIRKRKRQT